MKQRRINATLKRALPPIAALALITFFILTVLPLASATAHRLERQPPISLIDFNSTQASERGAPSAASVVQSAGTTTRVSVGSNGMEGNRDSVYHAISADGRCVAFVSDASNLVPGDTNDERDIFLRDRHTRETTRVSVATGGAQANSGSNRPAISGDGCCVAFHSYASNLVGDDTNGRNDIFIHEWQTGQTRRVSIATGGGQANGSSEAPSLSADARLVAFESWATNLVSGDTNNVGDIFVHDRHTRETTRVSVATGGAEANGDSWWPAISADGRYVAFASHASTLVPGDTNNVCDTDYDNERDDNCPDVFVHDRQTGETTRVSVADNGAEGNGSSKYVDISADGHYVAFMSSASNLVSGDTNDVDDIFVHDRWAGQTRRVSVSSNDEQANDRSCYWVPPAISADGRYVAFDSLASNLVPGDTNNVCDTDYDNERDDSCPDVFVHDRKTGETTRVSVATDGTQGNCHSWIATISGDGRYVGFTSCSNNLVGDDTNGAWDVFVHDRGGGPGPMLSISHIEVTQAIQDESNSVPLIADKPTFVRVYVDCGEGCTSLPNVTGVLRGYGPSGELPGSPLAPFGGSITAYHEGWRNQRNDLRKTLNFSLPKEWLTGPITLTAEVNGASGSDVFTFAPGKKLRLAWVAMQYSPPQPPPPPGPTPTPIIHHPDQEVAGKGITDLLTMYPVASDDVAYVFQPGFEGLMVTPFDCSGDCPADTQYLRALNDFWNRMIREGRWVGDVWPDRLYGWVPKEAQGNLCGIADAIWDNPQKRKGRVAAGVDSCGAETLAHELGHILNDQGLRHTPNGSRQEDPHCVTEPGNPADDYPPYPGLPLGSIGEWGTRITDGAFELLDPALSYDFMSYCSPEWVSPFNYEKLNQGFAPVATSAVLQALTISQRQFLASGIVFSPALTVTLSPLYVITSTVPPDPDTAGAYCLELRNSSQALLDSRCFDLTFTNPETGEPTGGEGFSLALPYPDGTQAVVVTHNGAELAQAAASPSTPQVQVLSPNGGEVWQSSGIYTVTWIASDADGETIHYAISFSPDGGVSWNPIVLDTTETQWVVDASRLPGSANAMIRVQASDGFNAGMDVSDSSFTVERKGPEAFILSPKGDIAITVGTPLWLQGYAYDLEDGTLGDAALHWSSDRDGDLGAGKQALTSLSAGQHVVTLTAIDSDDNPSSDSVSVFVGYRIFLPLVVRDR